MENHTGCHLNKTQFEISLGYFIKRLGKASKLDFLVYRQEYQHTALWLHFAGSYVNFVQWVILSAAPRFTQHVLVCSILDFAHTESFAKLGTKLTSALHTA